MDQNNASPKKMNVGLIGAGFMAKAHSIAYAGMPMFFWPAPIIPVKKMIVDMNEAIAKEAKDKFAFESYSTDWHDVVNNPEIDVVDICTPNNVHAEIAIAVSNSGILSTRMNRIYIFPINSRSYPNFIPRLCNFCCIINMTKRHLFCTITIMTSIYIYINLHEKPSHICFYYSSPRK